MNTTAKTGAALRLRNSAEPVSSSASPETDSLARRAEALRENLYRFPKIGIPPVRAALQVEPPRAGSPRDAARLPEPPNAAAPSLPAPSLAGLEDLAAELEAALMGDLHKATLAASSEPEPVAAKPNPLSLSLSLEQAEIEHGFTGQATPARKEEVPQQDKLAVELLLSRGQRQPQIISRPEPAELEDRLAGELAQRLSEAVDGLNAAESEVYSEERELERKRLSFDRFPLNKSLVGIAVALAVVGGGALVTVHSLTANPATPVPVKQEVAAAAGEKADVAPAAPVAKSDERAAEDKSLHEPPQLRGADMLSTTGSLTPAASMEGAPAADPGVRSAFSMDSAAPDSPAARVVKTSPVPATQESQAALGQDPASQDPASPDTASQDTASNETASPDSSDAVASADSASAGSDTPADVAPAAPARAAPARAHAASVPAKAIADLPSGKAQIASGVKLRGNPDNSAPTVGYLKAGTQVDVVSCKGWCEVVADGKRGFVFKRFLTAL
ncbi:hypothetical protein K32_46740 [Kaistia sp. 32K]|uniref:SH3 domain-containing protein n=1 Tax=Kaistia sp. 32K TaxID=2795690 RepID=UPI0019164881|nr:SH3 domain-containing protein [Kaistia sp. 32K]BCP56057.1 hypothetical protein K32_46740 [Kaistia sp. 32K]